MKGSGATLLRSQNEELWEMRTVEPRWQDFPVTLVGTR